MGLVRLPSEAEQGQFPNRVHPLFGRSVVPILLVGNGVSGSDNGASDLLAGSIHTLTL